MAGRSIGDLPSAGDLFSGDKFLVQQGLVSKKVDRDIIMDHSKLSKRNAVGAHDEIYGRHITVSEIAASEFNDGDHLIVTDRDNAKFKISSIGVADGKSILSTATFQVAVLDEGDAAKVNVRWLGAKGDDVVDDTVDINAAILYSSSSSGPSSTYQPRKIWFPSGTYLVSSALLFPHNYRIDGDGATIKAAAGFTPVVKNNVGDGGTVSLDAVLLFLLGDYNDISAPQRPRASIGNGITVDCNEVTSSGLYMERMPYSNINCKVMNTIAGGNAIDCNVYNWGTHINGAIVENFAENGIAIGLGSNGVTITSPRVWGETKVGVSGVLIKPHANVNGVSINGGFIEKIAHGLSVGRGNGSIAVAGVDFEVCTINCITVSGDPADDYQATVDVRGCYMSSVESNVYTRSATVVVESCRLRAGPNFETAAPGGFIDAKNNNYETGLPNIVANCNVALDVEQSFSPTLLDDSLDAEKGQVYTIQSGKFSRVRDKVYFKMHLQMSSLGSLVASHNTRIGGLPFTSNPAVNTQSAVSVGYATGLSLSSASGLSGYVPSGVGYIQLQKFSATTGSSNVLLSEVTAGGGVIISGWYSI